MSTSASKIALLVVLAATLIPLAAPAVDGYAQPNDVSISPSLAFVDLGAGESEVVWLDIHNKLKPTDEDPCTLIVYVNVKSVRGFEVEFPNDNFIVVDGGDTGRCRMVIVADRYVETMDTSLSFDITINDPDRGFPIHFDADDLIRVHLSSAFDSDVYYNRFFGLVDNNLPSFFGTSFFAALVTFLNITIIGLIASKHVLPFIGDRLRRFDSLSTLAAKDFAFEPNKILRAVLLLANVLLCMMILGVQDVYVGYMLLIFELYATVVIGYAAWNFYEPFLGKTLAWFDDDIDDGRDSSLFAMALVIGKILIASLTVMLFLIIIGVESTVASVGAAAAGLAVSFGAQSTLAQFFGGLTILMNKPFVPGDVVRLDGDSLRLKVIKVGLMETRFREWETDETYCIPNNKVAEASIVNMTHGKKTYIMMLVVDFPYYASYDLVKDCINRALKRCPHVVTEAEDKKPLILIDGFSEDGVLLKVLMHVDDFKLHDDITSEARQLIIDEMMNSGIEMIRTHKQEIRVYERSSSE